MLSRRVFSVLALAVLLAAAPVAQTPPPVPPPQDPQRPIFRGGVDSVTVDVIVTDRQGRPVLDLEQADFDVREDGKPQTIDTFRLVLAGDANLGPTRSPSNILSTAQHQTETASDGNRLFAIFLDDYHTRRLNSLRVRQQLADWVRTLQPHDLVALVYPLLPVNAITFSRNHEGTAMALMSFEGRKYDYTAKNAYEERLAYQPPQIVEQERNRIVMAALEGLCLYMGGLREGRKSIVFVSEGFSATMPLGVFTRGSSSPLGSPAFGGGASGYDERLAQINTSDLQNQLRYVYVAASRSNTAIYSLDPRGTTPNEFSVEDRVDQESDRRVLTESIDTLHQLANETDGRAIVNRNDPGPGLDQLVTDSSGYYLLSYVSSEAPRDGKFHRIDVRVNRRDIEVRARKGYWAYTPEDVERALAPEKPGPPPDVTEAMTDLVAVRDAASRRPLLTWVGASPGEGPEARLTLVWEANGGGAATGFNTVSKVTLTATAATGDEVYRGEVPGRPDAARPAGTVEFLAPPGPLSLRLVAENDRGVRLENATVAFIVPDFAAVGPSLTKPVIYRARTARDVQTLRAAENPIPSATRTFMRSERLLLRFHAYGPGGSTPALTMELLNRQGEQLVALPNPTQVAGSLFEAVLGLGSLPPGDYILAVVATSGTETIRDLIAIQVTS